MWNEIKTGVPQWSILGPLLFNAVFNDILMLIEKNAICNSADDINIHHCGKDLSNILEHLKHDLKILLKCFRINSLQINFNSIYDYKEEKAKFGKFIINSTQIEESKIDNLSMSILIIYLVQRIHVLQRIRKYLSLEKGERLCKVFRNSQFNYAPLVRMFC